MGRGWDALLRYLGPWPTRGEYQYQNQYQVPEHDLKIPLNRVPARVRNGLGHGGRPAARADRCEGPGGGLIQGCRAHRVKGLAMHHRTRSRTPRPGHTRGTGTALLGIYLNDHLAGATAGVERARHMARSYGDSALASAMEPLADEIAEDREFLLEIMRRLDIPVRHYKVYAGQVAERVGRLKSNGRLVRRSPLSPLLELEALRLGVEGKTAGWQALRELADGEERLDPQRLDDLLERARRQQSTLEELRRREVPAALQEA